MINYRGWLVTQMMKKVLDEQKNRSVSNSTTNLPNKGIRCSIKTYKEKQDENVIHSLGNNLYKVLQQAVGPKLGTMLSEKFQINDKTKDEHKHDLAHYAKCPEYVASYVGQKGRRLQDLVDKHSRKDNKSNILRQFYHDNHKNMSGNNFHFLGNGYKKMKFKRKLSDGLCINELRPSFNIQGRSGVETFYLNFSGGFETVSDICDGVFENIVHCSRC